MEIAEKVIPYIIKGSMEKEKVGDIRFELRNTKQEEAFIPFSQPTSPLTKFCLMASEDPLLSLFSFLKPYKSSQPIEDYPLILKYPLFVDFDEKFLGSIAKDPIKTKVSDTKQKKEDVEKNVNDLSSRLLWKMFSVAVSDKQVQDRMKRRRLRVSEKEMDELFSGLFNRRKRQFETISKDMVDVASSLYYSMEYYVPLLEAFEHIEEAKENLSVLSSSSNLKDFAGALTGSLSKLIAQRIFRIKTSSFCMECTLKKGFEPFNVTVNYPFEPVFPRKCEKCNGGTIYQVLQIEAPYSFGPLLEENRLPEFIIGFTLARSKKIKKLYIHKKVQVITEKGPLQAQQINIFAITENDRILIIEVTTAKDLNKIWETVHKKEKALKGFPYDALVFITPSPTIEKYPRLNNVRIFGAGHLPKIVSHIDFLIDEMSKEKSS